MSYWPIRLNILRHSSETQGSTWTGADSEQQKQSYKPGLLCMGDGATSHPYTVLAAPSMLTISLDKRLMAWQAFRVQNSN